MDINNLRNDPRLANMDTSKLEILNEVLANAAGKSKNEILPYFMSAAKKAEASGVSFTNQETDLLFEILTKDMSAAEKARISYMRKLAAMVSNKQKGI